MRRMPNKTTYLLACFLEAVRKIAGSLNRLPACVRERLAGCRSSSDEYTHDDGRRKDALEIDLRGILSVG